MNQSASTHKSPRQKYIDPEIAKQHILKIFLASFLIGALPIIYGHAILLYFALLTNIQAPAAILLYAILLPFANYCATKRFNEKLRYRFRGYHAFVERSSYAGRKNDSPQKASNAVFFSSMLSAVIYLVCAVMLGNNALAHTYVIFGVLPASTIFMFALSCFFFFRRIQLGEIKTVKANFPIQEAEHHSFTNDPNDIRNTTGFSNPWSPNAPLSMLDHNNNMNDSSQSHDHYRDC